MALYRLLFKLFNNPNNFDLEITIKTNDKIKIIKCHKLIVYNAFNTLKDMKTDVHDEITSIDLTQIPFEGNIIDILMKQIYGFQSSRVESAKILLDCIKLSDFLHAYELIEFYISLMLESKLRYFDEDILDGFRLGKRLQHAKLLNLIYYQMGENLLSCVMNVFPHIHEHMEEFITGMVFNRQLFYVDVFMIRYHLRKKNITQFQNYLAIAPFESIPPKKLLLIAELEDIKSNKIVYNVLCTLGKKIISLTPGFIEDVGKLPIGDLPIKVSDTSISEILKYI